MLDFRQSLINSALRKVLKRRHYPLVVMLIYNNTALLSRVYEQNSLRKTRRQWREIAERLHIGRGDILLMEGAFQAGAAQEG